IGTRLLNPPEPTPTGQPSDLTGPYGVDQQGSCLGTAGENPHRPSRPPESLDRSLARGHRPTGYPSFLDDSHRPRALLRTAPHGSKADALIPWMKKAWVQIADRTSPPPFRGGGGHSKDGPGHERRPASGAERPQNLKRRCRTSMSSMQDWSPMWFVPFRVTTFKQTWARGIRTYSLLMTKMASNSKDLDEFRD